MRPPWQQMHVFDFLNPALSSSLEISSFLLQGSSAMADDSGATQPASGNGVKVSSIVSLSCQLVQAVAESTAAFMDKSPR